ncbi:hypothetical protein G5I_13895 [Acromyrmex echinatior]|uniref:Uncharacterized protein n=1 Tax=Acromyrmex echinatior TaxID=103372 RepID=F4X685_ACREC|nr:hypothetical protein G5I_13895 [Acromyrmex echinatior]
MRSSLGSKGLSSLTKKVRTDVRTVQRNRCHSVPSDVDPYSGTEKAYDSQMFASARIPKFGEGDNEGEWKGYEKTVRLNLTGIRAEMNTCESHALFRFRNVNQRRDAMTPVPRDDANVSPTFLVKELNPFDPGLDLVRSQSLKRKQVRGEESGAGAHRDEVLVQDDIRGGVALNVDCNYSTPFLGGGRIQSK